MCALKWRCCLFMPHFANVSCERITSDCKASSWGWLARCRCNGTIGTLSTYKGFYILHAARNATWCSDHLLSHSCQQMYRRSQILKFLIACYHSLIKTSSGSSSSVLVKRSCLYHASWFTFTHWIESSFFLHDSTINCDVNTSICMQSRNNLDTCRRPHVNGNANNDWCRFVEHQHNAMTPFRGGATVHDPTNAHHLATYRLSTHIQRHDLLFAFSHNPLSTAPHPTVNFIDSSNIIQNTTLITIKRANECENFATRQPKCPVCFRNTKTLRNIYGR